MGYYITLGGCTYPFADLKEVLAKANEEKSGDQLAGIAARDMRERVAAKAVLAGLTLGELRDNPVIPLEVDEVSRLIDGMVMDEVYSSICSWTVGELREYILRQDVDGAELMELSTGLTSEMIAAVAKLMTNLDLIQAAAKIEVKAECVTAIGGKGFLASRAQPNHPTDSVPGVLASMYEAFSYGIGDAVIGINPVNDDPRSIRDLLQASKDAILRLGVPTQNCVLGHVSSQMQAIEMGAPADLIFQSLAGTEKANASFGIDIALLNEADALIRAKGTAPGPNRWYFETGQGSELSSECHAGVDQVTLEARCYGLARYYKPFLVNTVVGYFGPEYLYDSIQVIRAGLEDHFMGKMHGLPMGVDVRYTNHMKADQNDMDILGVLLATAGVQFLIGVPMTDDCMLNYQSLSYHDIATLRETLGLHPAPPFEAWLESRGLMKNGRLSGQAGNGDIFEVRADSTALPTSKAIN